MTMTTREMYQQDGGGKPWTEMSVEEHLAAAQRAVAHLGETWTSGYFRITPLQVELAKIHVAAAQVLSARGGPEPVVVHVEDGVVDCVETRAGVRVAATVKELDSYGLHTSEV
jgi:hypothetical protein